MTERDGTYKSFSLLTVFSLLEKIIAFVYQLTVAAFLGAELVTDCYFSATQLFDLIDSALLGALVVSVINRFSIIEEEEGSKRAFVFISQVCTWSSIVMVILSIVVFVFAEAFSFFIAPGFDPTHRSDLIFCIRMLCIVPILAAWGSISQSILRKKKHYILASSKSLLLSMCGFVAVGYMTISGDLENTYALCLGYVGCNLLFTLFTFMKVRKYGSLSFEKPRKDIELKKLLQLAIPTVISTGVLRISLVIDQILSSLSGSGAITCLAYSQSLYNMVSSLLIVNLGVVLLTDFTELCLRGDSEGMLNKVRQSVSLITLILAPITILCVIFSYEIPEIVYQRGAFTEESTLRVAGLLLFYSLGYIPAMLNNVHTQVLYAYGKMDVAMKNSLVAIGVNIATSVLLVLFIGQNGVAIGTTVSAVVGACLNKRSVQKCLSNYTYTFNRKYLAKITVASVCCCACASVVKNFIASAFFSFVVGSVCGLAIVFLAMMLMKDESVLLVIAMIKGKANGAKK